MCNKTICKMLKRTKNKQLTLSYKKVISFTEIQHETLIKLEKLNINVNQFIRAAVREKIQRDLPEIRERKLKTICPF